MNGLQKRAGVGSGTGRPKPSPWSRFIESAVTAGEARGAGAGPATTSVPEGERKWPAAKQLRARISGYLKKGSGGGDGDGAGRESPRRRTDVRLALPAAMVWAASVAGLWLPPTPLAILCLAGVCTAAILLATVLRTRPAGRYPARRSFAATTAVGLMLSAAAAAHSSAASSQRFDGPLAEAIASGKTAVAVVEVAGTPRSLSMPGQVGPPARWSVPVWTADVATGGVVLRTRAQLVVTGTGEWGTVVPGQTVRATGKLGPADPGRVEAGTLSASSPPGRATGGSGLERAAKDLRMRFVAASSYLAPDAAGLLPGMVTGDTSALDAGLENSMKTVGMTHLTAVSGANCSLVLGALLLAARGVRLPRALAAAVALGGLGLFVILVGPDASVLRAALMGGVAVAALASGRSGRGLSFLCLAVIGLLLIDPGLGGSFGFLLSVLATLGIIVVGRRIIDWTPSFVPRWAAAAVAVPLSAQVLCGPVIVLLQPQFSTYSLLANVAAAPLVAPVTLLGTAAVPIVAVAPWPALVLIAVAGTFCAGIAGTARFAAGLPGSSLPWPEGIYGMLTMLLLSGVTLAAAWAAARPGQVVRLARAAHRRAEALLGQVEQQLTLLRHRCRFVCSRERGRLEYSTNLSRRDPRWPLRKSEQPVPRPRTRPPGGKQHRRPWSWSAGQKNTLGSGRWTASVPRSARPPRTSK
ncbi:ComEC/Rec2 family competence protein [Pseudarthrobacter sp. NamE2]|uniref:ComEC/Rec2 family competence protein n=1 Tax=Pseudarthrobacter sp. NamE2 TaxID=2576838 RepID=UPI001F0D10DC|nr:ComEC/Rec2 family competence protein [Pseudarthrobacter sp. NamE2]